MSTSSIGTNRGNELLPLRGSNQPTMQQMFSSRVRDSSSISPDQALIHMIKVMMGTGMLSLPLAFKHAGLWLGLILLAIICFICIYCTRQLVYGQHYITFLKREQRMDYANVMRYSIELGPSWIRGHGYLFKQLVNLNMFVAQFGFCCVYFVFMADNIKQFFDQTSTIQISQSGWIGIILIPVLALCTIRELKALAPLAAIANAVYIVAVFIVLADLFSNWHPWTEFPAFASFETLPLFFGTVMFAFEGVAVVLPIENQMNEPIHFITPNGVLNTSCTLVLLLYMIVGFFGYLRYGNDIKDTLTLNLPITPFYQAIKIMFVLCILVSYPLQFYVPMERVEKWIKRKIVETKQEPMIYAVRIMGVLLSCAMAQLIPHLALFISLVGSIAGTSLTLVFPPLIDLLCSYSKQQLTTWVWIRNIGLIMFAFIGFSTGTYASLVQIIDAFGTSTV